MNNQVHQDDSVGNIPLLDELTDQEEYNTECILSSHKYDCLENIDDLCSEPLIHSPPSSWHRSEKAYSEKDMCVLPEGLQCTCTSICMSPGPEFGICDMRCICVTRDETASDNTFEAEKSKSIFSADNEPEFAVDELLQPNSDNIDLANFDSDVMHVPSSSLKESTCTYTDILKQELNCKIQIDRLKQGKSELFLIPEAPKTYELREDEIRKKNRRLEQNRQSSHRSRAKSSQHLNSTMEKLDEAIAENKRLQSELSNLKAEKSRLMRQLSLRVVFVSK